MLMTLRTIGCSSGDRASLTSPSLVGSDSLTSMLANSGFESRYWVRSSRPCSSIRSRNSSSAWSRVMTSTSATSGRARMSSARASIWVSVALGWM